MGAEQTRWTHQTTGDNAQLEISQNRNQVSTTEAEVPDRRAKGETCRLVFASAAQPTGEIDEHTPRFDFHIEASMPYPGAQLALTVLYIELPSVPRTRQNAAIQLALAQRASLMRADAIHRIQDVFDLEEGYDIAFDDKFGT